MTLGSKFWIFQALQTPVFFHPFSDVLKLTFSTWPWEKLPCLVHLSLVLPKDQNPWGLRFFCPHLEFKPTKFSIFGWTCDSKMVWDTSPLWRKTNKDFLWLHIWRVSFRICNLLVFYTKIYQCHPGKKQMLGGGFNPTWKKSSNWII